MFLFVCVSLSLSLKAFHIYIRQFASGSIENTKDIAQHVSVFFALFSVMAYAGYLVSVSLKEMLNFSPLILSLLLFFYLGMKGFSALRKNSNWVYSTGNFRVLFMFAIASSIDFFICGTAAGFYADTNSETLILFAGILLLFFTLAIIAGLSKRKTRLPFVSGFLSVLGIFICLILALVRFFEGMV